MSSSAFTPSTTTVTNNVPVNVPVVTAWEAYTPDVFEGTTLKNSDFLSRNGRHRRVGDSVQIEMVLLGNSNARSGTGQFCVSIPSGLTIDTTKLSDISRSLTGNISIGTGSPLDGVVAISRVNNLIGAIDKAAGPIAYNNTTVNPASGEMSIYATIPIAEWAGSGTTTLATRAVEEYAWNSDTGVAANTTYSNSSFFGNGPNGTPLLSVSSTTSGSSTRYVCQFQTNILPTDSIILEFSSDRLNWFPIGGGNNGSISSLMYQSGALYGASVRVNTGNQVIVDFGNFGRVANGATYAAAGASWSGLTGWFWRVRKISSGAQVGYPVSARNIVGDTSGTVVPVGMLGEKIKSSWVTGSVTSYTYTVLGSSGITLNSGTYNINVYFRISPNNTTTLTSYIVFPSTSNANNDNGVIFDADNLNVWTDYKGGITNPNGDSIRGITPTYQIIVPAGSTQTIYPKVFVIFGTSTCTAGLQIVAHRIA